MKWTPKEKEIEAVLAADSRRRYEYFIHRVCDTRQVWGLYAEGWASLGDSSGQFMPFWPHQVYAARAAMGGWDGYEPREIELDVFLEKWIPGLKQEGVEAAIFPVGTGSAIAVSLEDLEANLRYQLRESYGEES